MDKLINECCLISISLFGRFSIWFLLVILKTNLFSHRLSKCNFILNFDFYALFCISRERLYRILFKSHHINVYIYIMSDWFTATPRNFKANLAYQPAINLRYNIHCVFWRYANFYRLMCTRHTSMICTFQRELSTFNIIQVKRKKIQIEMY